MVLEEPMTNETAPYWTHISPGGAETFESQSRARAVLSARFVIREG